MPSKREAALERWRKWREANPNATCERHRERERKRREADPDRILAYNREWYTANRERAIALERKYQAVYPEKRRAHQAVARAIKAGRLERGLCECAGDECRGRIEAHHEDYSKPLDVRWLCKAHHTAAHLDTAN